MVSEKSDLNRFNKISVLKNINNFQHFVFITIILGLIFLFKHNFYIFHSAAEMFSCIIAGGVLLISLSTYKFTRNDFFMFLGIGYLFILTIDMFHAITYGDLIISTHFVYDIDTRFWVAARGLELATYLISFVFLFKSHKKFNFYIVFIVYYVITFILIFDISHINILIPTMRLEETGLTEIKLNLEYFISTGFVICCLILFIARNKINKSLFIFLEISLICKVFSDLCFTMYLSITDLYNMMGHILKVISYYFLYMGVIVNGLQRPFDMIKHVLDNADIEIKEKEKQRRYMEEIIYQNEHCYDWIIDNSTNGIIIVRNTRIVYANTTAINILGAKNINDITGKEVKELLFDNSIELETIAKESNNLQFNELKLLKFNKDTLDVEYSINNVTYRGTPAYLILFKDTKLKKEINILKSDLIENKVELIKSNEHNQVLIEFFSNISHDLKTPINVILSALQLILIKEKDLSFNEFIKHMNRLLGIIKQNCFRLIRLVSNLNDISKFESGFLMLDLKNRNIVSVVEDITLSVGDYIRSKGVNIIFDTEVEERIIAVDGDKIERIMLNLLSNAVKFTDKDDEIFVNIEDSDDIVRISVKDTGVGISDDKLKMIFDRFAQVDNTLARNKEGCGIGLSLVKSLTEMHGGNIKVKSKEKEGSEFIIELPIRLTKGGMYDQSIDVEHKDNKIDKILIEFSDIYLLD